MATSRGLLIFSIIIKSIVTGVGTAGILSNFSSGPVALLFFTIQSNLFMVLLTIPFLIEDIVRLTGKPSFLPGWLLIVKYTSTFSVTITFLVFTFLLIPSVSPEFLASFNNYSVHVIVPLVAIFDLFFFGRRLSLNRFTCLFALLCPVCYFIFFLIGSLNGLTYIGGSFAPYFFLDYQANGWFNVSDKGLGTFYWFIILFAFFILLCYLFLFFIKLRKGELFKRKKD